MLFATFNEGQNSCLVSPEFFNQKSTNKDKTQVLQEIGSAMSARNYRAYNQQQPNQTFTLPYSH